MTTPKFLLSTLVAASVMAIIPATTALAAYSAPTSGSGTESDPYSGTTTDFYFPVPEDSDTVYISGLSGYLESNTAATYSCNINIGTGGFTINNGYSGSFYTFTGAVSGAGDWTFGSGTVTYHLTFTGDWSNYSGNLSVTTGPSGNNGPSYIYFGNNTAAATDTKISGTGAISCLTTVKYNYSDYASADSTTLTVENSSISAKSLEFAGSVNYTVSSNLIGYDSTAANNTLTISNAGTTKITGSISNFGTLSVASGATLDISGASVGLTTAIQNSGTVTIDSNTVFALDNWEYTGDWDTGATFTLFTGDGTVTGLDLSNLTLDNFSSKEIFTDTTFTVSGFTVTFTAVDLVWNGTEGNNSWTTDSDNSNWEKRGSAAYFVSNEYVEFTSAAAYKTVSIATDITTGKAIVSDDYTFSISNGASLTATKLEVKSGSTLTISAEASGSVVTADLEGEGTIVLNGTSSADSNLRSLPGTPDIQLFTTSTNNETRTVEVASGVVLLGATGSEVVDTYSLGTNTTLKIDSGATFLNNNSYLTLANLEISGTFWQVDGARTDNTTNNTALTIGTTTVSGSDATIALYWNKKLNLGTLNGDSDATLTILGASQENSTTDGLTLATLGDFSGSLVITGRNGSDMLFQLTRPTTDAASMAALSLTNSTFLVYNGANNNGNADSALTIGQVTVSGSGTISTTYWQGYFVLNALSGTNATLYLTSEAASSVCAIYELGASVSATATNDFTGTIDISDTNDGSRRSVSLVISNADIAKGAVINFGTEASSDGSLSLGVNVDGATVAGLSSASDHGGTDMIYSGKISPMDTGVNGANITSDDTARTLIVNVAADASYDFYGVILNNVNITKSGDGSQAIHDSSGRFDGAISVTGGTLILDGSFAMSALSTTSGATLSLSSGASSVAATDSSTVSSSGMISIADGASLSISGSSGSSLSATIANLAGEGTLSLSDISVSTTQNTQNPFTGSLVLSGSNTAFQLTKGNVTASLASVSLSDSATFALYSSGNNNGVSGTILTIDQVAVSGTGTIETRNYQGHIVINNLSGDNAQLSLGSKSTSDVCAVIELGTGISADATNDFTGTIEISDTATGDKRSLSLVISDGSIASGAVISFGTENATSDSLSLGVNASTVTVAGLTSAADHNGADIIYSGSVTPTQLGESGANLSSDDTVRTLVINTAADASYDFYGTILANVNLEKTGEGSQAIHGDGTSFDGAVAVSAGTLTLDGAFTLSDVTVSSGATLDIAADSTISEKLSISGTLAVTDGAVVDLTGVTSSQAGGDGTLVISGEGSTAKVSLLAHGWGGRTTNFGSDMYNATLQIADGGTLEVTTAQISADTSGGDRAFSVTSGTGTYRYSGDAGTTSNIDNVSGRNIHLADDATLVFDVTNEGAALSVAMGIANGMSATADVADSATTSTGSVVKTGAGTLELSGENLYSGGTTISEGVLVVGSDNALGSGTVSIEGGSQLSINSGVTVKNDISLVLTETYLVSGTANAAAVASITADNGNTYAITGEGTLTATITISADEAVKSILADDASCKFAIIEYGYDEDDDITFELSDELAAYYTLSYVSNGIFVLYIPEPSMFGIVAGLGALALAATRRNRRRHNRKA
ncbi:MAG: autotransporter-associated beta strand repeat-containing protein [Opitutae bacterium]|nr:autotransporter-associated beta strand repeat-containing protein [Opitutae bacterium]